MKEDLILATLAIPLIGSGLRHHSISSYQLSNLLAYHHSFREITILVMKAIGSYKNSLKRPGYPPGGGGGTIAIISGRLRPISRIVIIERNEPNQAELKVNGRQV